MIVYCCMIDIGLCFKSCVGLFLFKVSILQNENLLLKKNSDKDWGSQSKSLSDYAGQLSGAASNAEAQLKQLLKGCESLRLVAGSLESYGKIQEMKEPNKKNTK